MHNEIVTIRTAIAKINDALQYTALNFFMNLFMSAPVTVLFFQFIHNC